MKIIFIFLLIILIYNIKCSVYEKYADTPSFILSNFAIYVVSLKHREDRKNKLIEQFKKNNITNYVFTTAVNGKDINIDELKKNNTIEALDKTKGQYGCYLSHINIWKMLLDDKNNLDSMLILEEDAKLADDFINKFNEIIKRINLSKAEWDIVYLGVNCFNEECKEGEYINENNEKKELGVYVNKNIYYPKHIIYGTHGYIIKKSAVKKILADILPIKVAYDIALMEKCLKKDVKCLTLVNPIITVDNYNDSETQKIV